MMNLYLGSVWLACHDGSPGLAQYPWFADVRLVMQWLQGVFDVQQCGRAGRSEHATVRLAYERERFEQRI
jgi:hypothetical protein